MCNWMLCGSFLIDCFLWIDLTHKELEMHGCVLSAGATDALALKHQAISAHSAG